MLQNFYITILFEDLTNNKIILVTLIEIRYIFKKIYLIFHSKLVPYRSDFNNAYNK